MPVILPFSALILYDPGLQILHVPIVITLLSIGLIFLDIILCNCIFKFVMPNTVSLVFNGSALHVYQYQ